MKLFAGLVLAFAIVSPAIAADRFDLICKGTQNNAAGGPETPFEERYRIDLAAKRWCPNECVEAAPIAEITPDRITLERDDVAIRRGAYPRYEHYIDRATGKAVSYASGVSLAHMICEAAPFSGMPAAKF